MDSDVGHTHWDGCWRDRAHHGCAVAMVERMSDYVQGVKNERDQARAEAERLREMVLNLRPHLEWAIANVRGTPDFTVDEATELHRRYNEAIDAWKTAKRIDTALAAPPAPEADVVRALERWLFPRVAALHDSPATLNIADAARTLAADIAAYLAAPGAATAGTEPAGKADK